MDRITKSLLEEFCREHSLQDRPEDEQFEHFATHLAMSRHQPDTFDTNELIVGSSGDTGFDAVGIVINGALVSDPDMVEELAATNGTLNVTFVFVQAERSPNFSSAKIGQITFGVQDFFRDTPTLPRNAAVEQAADVMAEVFKRSSSFRHGNPQCRVYYVTTGKWTNDQQLEARRRAAIEDLQATDLFRDVEFTAVGADAIQKLYRETKNAISKAFTFTSKTVIPDIPGVSQAYLGLLPGPEFLSIITAENGALINSIFYDNVRDWQDYNPVNAGIRDTIDSAELRRRFALMNNGVTIIAKTMGVTGNRFNIEDFQVVNGCQTSHVLYDCGSKLDSTVMVPVRVIATENEEVIASIIKATNSQTQVKAEQLLALSDFQKKLELFFESFSNGKRLYYERRSRQFASTVGIEKTRIVTLGNLIRAYASMFLEEPHRTAKNYTSLLDNVGKSIFVDTHRLEPYYVSAMAQYRLEFLFRNQTLNSHFKRARYYILLAFRLMAVSAAMPGPGSNEMKRYCDSLMEVLWDQDKAEEVIHNASIAVLEVADGNFDREHIRTQSITEKLKKYCSSAAT